MHSALTSVLALISIDHSPISTALHSAPHYSPTQISPPALSGYTLCITWLHQITCIRVFLCISITHPAFTQLYLHYSFRRYIYIDAISAIWGNWQPTLVLVCCIIGQITFDCASCGMQVQCYHFSRNLSTTGLSAPHSVLCITASAITRSALHIQQFHNFHVHCYYSACYYFANLPVFGPSALRSVLLILSLYNYVTVLPFSMLPCAHWHALEYPAPHQQYTFSITRLHYTPFIPRATIMQIYPHWGAITLQCYYSALNSLISHSSNNTFGNSAITCTLLLFSMLLFANLPLFGLSAPRWVLTIPSLYNYSTVLPFSILPCALWHGLEYSAPHRQYTFRIT